MQEISNLPVISSIDLITQVLINTDTKVGIDIYYLTYN